MYSPEFSMKKDLKFCRHLTDTYLMSEGVKEWMLIFGDTLVDVFGHTFMPPDILYSLAFCCSISGDTVWFLFIHLNQVVHYKLNHMSYLISCLWWRNHSSEKEPHWISLVGKEPKWFVSFFYSLKFLNFFYYI